MADWQTFPWGTVLTLATVLSTLILGALVNYLRDRFMSVKDADKLGDSLRAKIKAQADLYAGMRAEMAAQGKQTEEAYRMAQLTERSLGEQWQRVSEEIIRPVREMAVELRKTRELLIQYNTSHDALAKDFARMERRIDSLEDTE